LAVANETLKEAQSRMLRSASDYRSPERELAEAWRDACHPPGPRRPPPAVGRQHDYQEIGLDGAHVGVFVGTEAQGVFGEDIADWLRTRH
jgi:hypothetical protein